MNSIYNVSIADLMPSSMINDITIMQAADVIDRQIQMLNDQVKQLIIIPNINQANDEVLNLLSKQFSPPFYNEQLDIKTKRELIKNSITWHKTKGTVAALEDVVNTIFGGDSQIVEWYEYGGEPHHFKIITTQIGTNDSLIEEFKKVTEDIKRKSSVLEEVVVLLSNKFNIYYGFVLHTGDNLILRQEG